MNNKKLKIWIQSYRLFLMGGDVNAPAMTEVEDYIAVVLAKGIHGFLVPNPNGGIVVVDSYTGGVVGDNLDQVRTDIEDSDLKVIMGQLEEMKKFAERAYFLSNDEFWKLYNKAKQ